jgi:molecular chaperone HscA
MLVIDVGAGTTDIGAFKYNIHEGGAKVSVYRDGLRAIRTAGNRLDDALVELAWSKLGLAADSQLQLTHARKMRPAVRALKRDLFENRSIRVDVDGFDTVSIGDDEFRNSKVVTYFARTFEEQVKSALNSAGIGSRNFIQTNQPNIAVFTGGGASLPFLRELFDKPIELEGGSADFEVHDPVPAWVESYTADVAEVFPQLAVSTGGCSPFLPDEKSSVIDTTVAGARSLETIYKS